MSTRIAVNAEIRNKLGLHARPAMAFVDAASRFTSEVTVARVGGSAEPGAQGPMGGGEKVDGKSIMQMMMLAATKGTVLQIVVEGDDAEDAAATLKHLVDSGFDEE